MASDPLFIIPDFFLHFPNKLCYGYLSFEGNGKNPLGRQGKTLPSWLFQFSFAKLRDPIGPYLPKGIFPFPSNLR